MSVFGVSRNELAHMLGCVEQRLVRALNALKEDILASQKERYDALLAALDTETTRLGNEIAADIETIRAGGMSEVEETAVADRLQEKIDALKALGASPANPVPGVTIPPLTT